MERQKIKIKIENKRPRRLCRSVSQPRRHRSRHTSSRRPGPMDASIFYLFSSSLLSFFSRRRRAGVKA
ncbi:hypothetical protein IF1G_06332 [Cordyceps javanica]|uniref:Uncharacterized protein n=1 Tax=Cordyceps javanica TaxID=43265 RepID=A0A545V0T8_9HYPO|nr:hypothetical protein IF1G_06332 [Cordyceps javanica]